jgi:hypothetical protein
MSGVFIDPSPPGECVPPPLVRGEDKLAGWRGGGGVNSSVDARHCSVLYICKYFVPRGDSLGKTQITPPVLESAEKYIK